MYICNTDQAVVEQGVAEIQSANPSLPTQQVIL